MTTTCEPLPKEKVSTADLKNWIDSIPGQPASHASLHDWIAFIDAREKAWRAAFMWRETFPNLSCERERYSEYLAGMRLIQEHLV